jgi:hypothetical protein
VLKSVLQDFIPELIPSKVMKIYSTLNKLYTKEVSCAFTEIGC